MQKIRRPFSLATLLAFLLFLGLTSLVTPIMKAGNFGELAIINGLENGDSVILRLQPEIEAIDEKAPVLFEQSANGDNGRDLAVEIPTDLPDGYYRLTLESSSKYFRDPKGYFFQISQKQIVNPANRSFVFDLVLSSAQSYPTCTDEHIPKENLENDTLDLKDLVDDVDNTVCMAERMVSLSAPPRHPFFEEGNEDNVLTTGYHYFGPFTTQDNNGVRGRFAVVDPGVCHSGCSGNMFAADHVYAQYIDPGAPHGQRWMEVGWAEVSWQADNRYIFQYDSADWTWNLYDQLSTGTQLTVRVRQSSGNTWRAERYLGGSSWALLRERNIGFSTASNGYNKGEVYTDDWHPYFPPSTTDQSYLLIGGVWRLWDTRYSTTIMTPPHSYDAHVSNSYYKFCIHYHETETGACVP